MATERQAAVEINGRRRVFWWTATAVVTILGAIIWAVLCAASFAHGDAFGSLAHGVLTALAVYGAWHAIGKCRSWKGPRR